MTRKSVPFTVPGGPTRAEGSSGRRPAPGVIDARSDEWVSDRNAGDETRSPNPGASLVLDLTAERSFTEIVALSFMTPIALGGFWVLRAMMGKARF